MLAYAKFMKESITKKRTLESEMIEVWQNYSAILTRYMVTKEEDLDAFTVLCTIETYLFHKALCYL